MTDGALPRNRRAGVDVEHNDCRILSCSDSHVVAGHECALGVPDRLVADLDGAVEDVQVGVPARPRGERGRGPGGEAAVIEVDVVANV